MPIPIIPRGDVPANEVGHFLKLVSPPTFSGSNPDPQIPTITLRRKLMVGIDLVLADMGRVPMYIIEDPDAPDAERRTFPSRPIRIPLGAIVQADVSASTNTHTIHWHGIEPTPMNDGMGHTAFELTSSFTYQFQPREPGTYFYHCHKNTVLHFELGMYGLLLVDPPDPAAPGTPVTYPVGGPGFAAMYNSGAIALSDHVVHYDKEAFWVADSIDTRWHSLGHNAFMQSINESEPMNPSTFSQDGFLNDFRPDIFVLSGLPRRKNDPAPYTTAESPLVAPTIGVGQTLLIRVVNADYLIQQFTLGIDAEVIAMDGHALGVPPLHQYSRTFRLPANTPFRLTSAMRWDLIVKPTATGVFPATVEFLNQITGQHLYTAHTTITVA
jgi:FtsP/CotA-like multicopper oxidase with cupredoxin domain